MPAPKVAAPPEAPARPAPAPIPEGELFDQYRRRLEQNPDDHVNRLALARALHGGRALAPSLEQYETLIDSAQLLPDVSDDLSSLSQDYPEVPRVRRLLGDVFMRRGMLQEALNAYRSALEQL
jgi:tetratricopeptide (TPR) repeat protein